MKESVPISHFKILRKHKIAPILKRKFLPHPNTHLLLAICVLGWGNFVFSHNFKMTDRCWFLHGSFGSLCSLIVFLGIRKDLFEIVPFIFNFSTTPFSCVHWRWWWPGGHWATSMPLESERERKRGKLWFFWWFTHIRFRSFSLYLTFFRAHRLNFYCYLYFLSLPPSLFFSPLSLLTIKQILFVWL